MLKIFSMVVGGYAENCYVVLDEETGRSFVVDPGDEYKNISEGLKANNLKPEFILLTHGHLDHVSAADSLSEEFNIPIYITKEDMQAIRDKRNIFGVINKDVSYIENGSIIEFCGRDIKVIGTPGHTRGGVCYYIDNILFSGDTLFNTSIGRTDMYGGNSEDLINSVRSRIFSLPDETSVFPGHGPSTSIAYEKSNNPFFN